LGVGQAALEDLVSGESEAWRGRSVLVTGHTGFTGGWLALWLHRFGASVHGYALNPPTEPALFDVCRIKPLLASDTRADLADRERVRAAFDRSAPEVVFHLAAQPLVREGYRDPLGTLATNVMGTAHVLDAARAAPTVRAVVVITTDKVYDNREDGHRYRESDPLGGYDPYSASKAAAEIVASSYRASFFAAGGKAGVATARAGNIIGGGDWAADRLVPDCLRAFAADRPVKLRYPQSVRPWQHVLDALHGYLRLGEHLLAGDARRFAKAWNFGPGATGDANAEEVAQAIARLWGAQARVERSPAAENPHEAGLLRLDSSQAARELGWAPRWPLPQALEQTVLWHRAWKDGADMASFSIGQIAAYEGAQRR
jgi:CDP-glucose 4,6-dehydratase